MIAAGMPPALAAANTQALELFARSDSDWVTDDVHKLLGRAARSFRQFADDHASAFAGA